MALATTLTIAAGVLAATTAGTYLLPRNVDVQRSAVIDATPAEIIALASSTDGFQRINPYASADPALKITPFGPVAGVGSGFAFDGKDGKGTQTVAFVSDTRVVYDIDMGAMGKPTQMIDLEQVEGGTRVTWSVEADMGHNPVFRVFGLFMDGMMGATFDQGLANLAKATA
ncbi:SRPBCC family protein [Pseudaestuariivita atlantica]|uniref:Polyketide cyclase n=1 Tax=Pseudaestuariivita atlantica TaxID=1317121 RepID=A0A0L1JPV8_9RHOB|nr:SRPBCC family protein [Pseudaestuariivita atlantica]KNG93804.1 polyketide cyclase [Pseudaestuariivita atlantica]